MGTKPQSQITGDREAADGCCIPEAYNHRERQGDTNFAAAAAAAAAAVPLLQQQQQEKHQPHRPHCEKHTGEHILDPKIEGCLCLLVLLLPCRCKL